MWPLCPRSANKLPACPLVTSGPQTAARKCRVAPWTHLYTELTETRWHSQCVVHAWWHSPYDRHVWWHHQCDRDDWWLSVWSRWLMAQSDWHDWYEMPLVLTHFSLSLFNFFPLLFFFLSLLQLNLIAFFFFYIFSHICIKFNNALICLIKLILT